MTRPRKQFQVAWIAVLALSVFIGSRACMEASPSGGGSQAVLAVGRSLGLLAVALLLLQPILALRPKALERVFGLDRLLAFHRFSAVLCLGAAFLHPMFVYGSGLRSAGPSGWRLWPVALGAVALLGVWVMVVSSLYRSFVQLHWEAWRKLHVIMALGIVPALAHVFIIQPDFRRGLWPLWWTLVLGTWLASVVWQRVVIPRMERARSQFTVAAVKAAAENVTEVTLSPENAPFAYSPGQFAFLRFHSEQVADEEHPFTISSTPSDSRRIQFTIKGSGDFTRTVGALRQGDTAHVSGPFGVFTPARFEGLTHLVMVAGGIGITPMLSVLRTYAMNTDRVPMTLLWSNRTTADTPYLDELADLARSIPELSVHHFLTQDTRPGVRTERLAVPALRELTPSHEAGVHVMLCGPRRMMRDLARAFRALGYPRSAVHYEDFAL
jgi:predicted ferric reductase